MHLGDRNTYTPIPQMYLSGYNNGEFSDARCSINHHSESGTLY